MDIEAFTDEIGMIHNQYVRLLTDQVVENIDISDESNIADEEEQDGTTLGSSTTTRTAGCPNEDKVCKGFMIKFENQESFFKIYPFHQHCSDESSLQLKYNVSMNYDNVSKCETLVAHSTACNRLFCDPEMASAINKCCSDIEHSPQFKKIIEVGSKSDLPSQSKLEVCNYQQLQLRYRKLKDQYNDEKLQNLDLLRKHSFLNQKCTLNSRFSELICSADIPCLKTLLEVCIRKGMGMKSILGRIEDAINKRYSPKNYDDTDMEKATLVLRIGGPRLLHVLHITDGLPSVSLTYQKNIAIAPNMIAGVDSSFEDRLKNNIASYSD